jgi:hypothetical protein
MAGLNLPGKPYDEVKSEFIRERIAERQFELDNNRKYIKDLIFLERVILDEITLKYPSGMKFNSIKNDHEEEYLKILQDLDEEKYQKEKQKKESKSPSYINRPTKKEELKKAKEKWLEVKA